MANKILNAVSSRFTVDNIITEKIAIGQKQLGTTIANEHNMSLYGDETRKFGKIFQTFLVMRIKTVTFGVLETRQTNPQAQLQMSSKIYWMIH